MLKKFTLLCIVFLMFSALALASDNSEHHEASEDTEDTEDSDNQEHHKKHDEEEGEEEEEEPITYTVTNEAWLDIGIKDSKDDNSTAEHLGRIYIGLFGDICPMAATNFGQLAKGVKRDKVKLIEFY